MAANNIKSTNGSDPASTLSTTPLRKDLGGEGGVALSCLIGALTGFLLTSSKLDFRSAILIYFVYAIVAGILIQQRSTDTIRSIFVRSLPSSTFLACTGALINGVLWLAQGMRQVTVNSCGASFGFCIQFPDEWPLFAVLIVLGFVVSQIFITVSAIAASLIVNGIIAIWDFGPQKLNKVNRLVKICATLLGSLAILGTMVQSYLV